MTAFCQAKEVKQRKILILDSDGMNGRCAFDGNQTFTLKPMDG